MGACLSCLQGNDSDSTSQLNETSPLLSADQPNYDEDAVLLLLKRQRELERIVGETNEGFIDINAFGENTVTSLEELGLRKCEVIGDDLKDVPDVKEVQHNNSANNNNEYYDQYEEDEQSQEDPEELIRDVTEQTRIVKEGNLIEQFE